MSVYAVQKTGDGRVISWNGKPIKYRVNQQHFSDAQRLSIQNAVADVAPRVRCGSENMGQTTRKPMNGKAVYELDDGVNLYIYAKYFSLIDGANPGALGFSDQHWVGDQYLGAIVVFNVDWFDDYQFVPWTFKDVAYHEMGHAVGLEHPTSQVQLMSPNITSLPWKSGDLEGFTVLRNAH